MGELQDKIDNFETVKMQIEEKKENDTEITEKAQDSKEDTKSENDENNMSPPPITKDLVKKLPDEKPSKPD